MQIAFKLALVILVGLHVVKPFFQTNLAVEMFVASVIVLLSGLTLMGKGFKTATLVFLLAGSLLLLYSGQPVFVWIGAVNMMTSVIAIWIVMQAFSIPIKLGEYNIAVRYWLNKSFGGPRALFIFTTVVTHVFTSFLMLGAIPVVVSLMEHTLKQSVDNYERFMATATSRGYCLASLWAPGAINLSLVMQATGRSWSEVFIPGVVLSILGVGLSYFIEAKAGLFSGGKLYTATITQKVSGNQREKYRAFQIIAVVLGLVLLTLVLDKLHFGAAYNRIILAGLVVFAVWMVTLRKQPNLKQIATAYWNIDMLKAADLAPFFIAIGLFSAAVENSELMMVIQNFLQGVSNELGLLAIVLIPLLIILCAVFGLHPFITIVMLGKILMLLNLPVPPLTIALCLALGGSISYMVSPFAGVIMTIAKSINVKGGDIAIRWNWFFCIAYFSVGIVFAYYWGEMFSSF